MQLVTFACWLLPIDNVARRGLSNIVAPLPLVVAASLELLSAAPAPSASDRGTVEETGSRNADGKARWWPLGAVVGTLPLS